jgi:hypothetical protein
MKRVLILAAILTSTLSSGQSEPTLKKTTDWIHNFTEQHGGTELSLPSYHGTSIDHITFKGCAATVANETSVTMNNYDGETPKKETKKGIFSVEFSLADIDPDVKEGNMDTHSYTVMLRTRDDAPLIHYGESLGTAYEMTADTEEAAQRLIKAVHHAVILCGGKPSTF